MQATPGPQPQEGLGASLGTVTLHQSRFFWKTSDILTAKRGLMQSQPEPWCKCAAVGGCSIRPLGKSQAPGPTGWEDLVSGETPLQTLGQAPAASGSSGTLGVRQEVRLQNGWKRGPVPGDSEPALVPR